MRAAWLQLCLFLCALQEEEELAALTQVTTTAHLGPKPNLGCIKQSRRSDHAEKQDGLPGDQQRGDSSTPSNPDSSSKMEVESHCPFLLLPLDGNRR